METRITEKTKTMEEYFRDWENEAFGYGYGTGEQFTLPLLKNFVCALPFMGEGSYKHVKLEQQFGAALTWLMIGILCKNNIINYGTSPRSGWLDVEGKRLKEFLSSKTEQELYDIVMDVSEEDNWKRCYRDRCCCEPIEKGGITYSSREDVLCRNPFWSNRVPPTEEEFGV